jgi:hypothetical protein
MCPTACSVRKMYVRNVKGVLRLSASHAFPRPLACDRLGGRPGDADGRGAALEAKPGNVKHSCQRIVNPGLAVDWTRQPARRRIHTPVEFGARTGQCGVDRGRRCGSIGARAPSPTPAGLLAAGRQNQRSDHCEGVKKSTSLFISSKARNLAAFLSIKCEMLRCAQNDRFEFFHTFCGVGVGLSVPVHHLK